MDVFFSICNLGLVPAAEGVKEFKRVRTNYERSYENVIKHSNMK